MLRPIEEYINRADELCVSPTMDRNGTDVLSFATKSAITQ
jgi:hypothetical protein